MVGAPRGAAINDGEDEDSLHLRRTASSYHLDVRLGAAVREIRQGKDGASVVLADGTVEPCDMVVVTVPLGVLKRGASTGGIDFVPPLCEAKRCAIDSLGMGTENKVALRWPVADIFWPRDQPYMQCTDPRFRFLNGDYFGKAGVLVVLVAPPYAQEMESLEDEAIVTDILELLRGAFTPGRTRLPPVAEAHVTRWGRDPHSFGSYSYDQVGSFPPTAPPHVPPRPRPGVSSLASSSRARRAHTTPRSACTALWRPGTWRRTSCCAALQ